MKIDLNQLDCSQTVKEFIELKNKEIELDNYSLKGAYGLILFGFHKLLNKRVALKIYFYENGIHDEVKLLASMNNENILKIHDAGVIDGRNAFFMTDEIALGDLDEFIGTKKLSYLQAIEITKRILNGTNEMHNTKNRLLHRDLKPSNILLSDSNIPIIADFGSVKKITNDDDTVNCSKQSTFYRPPESFEHGFHTFSSDIYQIGLIFYQLLGGYHPCDELAYLTPAQRKKHIKLSSSFDKSRYVDSILLNLIKRKKFIDLDSLPPYVDKGLKNIIRKATHPNHSERYQTCAEFLHALHQLGQCENWSHSEEHGYRLTIGDRLYQIKREQNGKYSCQKSADNGATWRRESGIKDSPSENKIVKDLKLKIKE